MLLTRCAILGSVFAIAAWYLANWLFKRRAENRPKRFRWLARGFTPMKGRGKNQTARRNELSVIALT